MSVETLSSAQRDLYQAMQAGKDKNTIIRELGLTEGTFAAQCTRIKNKGISLPNFPGHTGTNPSFGQTHQPSRQDVASGRASRPMSTGPGESKSVLNEVSDAGPAVYDVERTIKEAQARGDIHGEMRDLHPMAILGVTIQFMRLCGGRFHAHQIIEDVYGAVRLMAGDGPKADDVVAAATKPFTAGPESLTHEDLQEFLGKVEGVKGELEDLFSKFQPVGASGP